MLSDRWQEDKKRHDRVLNHLRRVPDNIILAVASRDLQLQRSDMCLCGWVVREALGQLLKMDPDKVDISGRLELPNGRELYSNPEDVCQEMFGGSADVWEEIYLGVTNEEYPAYADIERAFTNRVLEARSTRPSKLTMPTPER